MSNKNKPHQIEIHQIRSDIKIKFFCPNCGENYQSVYDQFDDWNVWENFTQKIDCVCGSSLNCDFSIDVSGKIDYTPPKEILENLPAPNQINLFTNKTIEEMESEKSAIS